MQRRTFLGGAAGTLAGVWSGATGCSTPTEPARKRIAALSSTYHVRSHSDNFITRFLEGYWINDRYHPPPCDIVSLYVDQIHPADISQRLSMAYGFRTSPTIEDALTLGTGELAVDGVLLICEHGRFPTNEKNQHLYPRFEYFEQVVRVFKAAGRAVPVFVDKHFSYEWEKAKQMYDWSRELGFGLMAGSSVSVTFRRPELDIPLDADLEGAVALASGWVGDGGLFHILETLQCFTERRKGGESGVRSVQLLEGDAVWEAGRRGAWDRSLVETALAAGRKVAPGKMEQVARRPVACLVEYNDGFRAATLSLGGLVHEYLAAVKLKGEPAAGAVCYIPIENSNNFSPLVDSIARMFLGREPDYPVERTLLTTGALSFLMDSWHQGQKRLETPMLNIAYRAPERSYFAPGQGS